MVPALVLGAGGCVAATRAHGGHPCHPLVGVRGCHITPKGSLPGETFSGGLNDHHWDPAVLPSSPVLLKPLVSPRRGAWMVAAAVLPSLSLHGWHCP